MIDFGVSAENETIKDITYEVGAPFFRAPELSRKNEDKSKADVYSLSKLILFLLSRPNEKEYYSSQEAQKLKNLLNEM